MVSPNLYGLRSRETGINRLRAQRVQDYNQVGKILVVTSTASDEALATIKFVQIFIVEPTFTFGLVLDTNQSYTVGKMPTANAVVVDWETIVQGPSINYLGARLGIVTTGEAGQRLWLHYCFSGQAIPFPAGPSPSNSTGNA